ncbi:MAG: hypothetical protein WKF84_11565 [Pyrinomonadaceae bacterium]
MPARVAKLRYSGLGETIAALEEPTEDLEAAPMPKYDEVVMTETPAILFEEMDNVAAEIEPSRLVEFPGATRSASCSQWRKDLSERVRQIQERRVRDLKRGINNPPRTRTASSQARSPTADQSKGHPLELVPSTDAPPMNPLVIAALKRIERARQPAVSSPRPRSGSSSNGGSSSGAATARVIEEHYQPEPPIVPSAPPVAPAVATTTAAASPLIEEQATQAITFPATPLISTYSPPHS